MIDTLFHELIMKEKIMIYIDDILIFTQTIDEYREIVKHVLQILANNKLQGFHLGLWPGLWSLCWSQSADEDQRKLITKQKW